ncbi:VanW family protein [Viridibacillus arvi]|uniref:VanW family protein n=1 Tax=Viridibacillus arvi TaxID=263475 RepID=UPI0034CE0BD3
MRFFTKITIITLLVFGFLVSFEYKGDNALAAPKGSTIGNVSIENLSKEDMKKKLNAGIDTWQGGEILIAVGEKEILLTGEDFKFDIDASIKQYELSIEKPWYAFWEKKRIVHESLIVEANPTLKEKVENQTNLKDANLITQILEAASYLKSSPIKVVVNDISIDHAERISFETIALSDSQIAEIPKIVDQLNGYLIEPENEVSFNGLIANVSNNESAMTIAASALHSAVVQSSFEILERHQANEVPSYVYPGYEAVVNPIFKRDFRFVSHSKVPAKIVATVKSGELKIELYSLRGNPKVSVFEEDKKIVKPRTIYRYSSYLEEGEREIAQQSEAGLQLLIFRTVTIDSGNEKTELISQNYYAPQNEIIELSSKQTAVDLNTTSEEEFSEECNVDDTSDVCKPTTTKRKKATKSKNGSPVPEGSYYTETGDIVTPSTK